jgi:TrmH family RNA methyltransferase
MLTSAANPLLKDVRRAIARGGLTDQGYLIAGTFRLLDEALRSGLEIRAILAAESAHAAVVEKVRGAPSIRIAVVDEAVFRKLADTESSQGVIALVAPPVWTLDQVLCGEGVTLALDGVQDPGNAGAIVRAAEAFGATGVLFTKGTVSPFNPKTQRASAGSLFRLPFVNGIEAARVRAAFEERGMPVYAAMPHDARSPAEVDLRRKCAIVIGSEGRGVSEALRRGAVGLSIPTQGVESLNAAVAAAILLYEARRQLGTIGS